MNEYTDCYKAIVIGTSSGGVAALESLLSGLPKDFGLAIVIVQHIPVDSPPGSLSGRFQKFCALPVCEGEPGQQFLPGHVYFAPPGYHLLIEKDFVFALDSGERQNYSRPSIDVLFMSAADAYERALIGIVLTGANEDGAKGLHSIRQKGGYAIVQAPESAHAPQMPAAALSMAGADAILPLEEMAAFIIQLCKKSQENKHANRK